MPLSCFIKYFPSDNFPTPSDSKSSKADLFASAFLLALSSATLISVGVLVVPALSSALTGPWDWSKKVSSAFS